MKKLIYISLIFIGSMFAGKHSGRDYKREQISQVPLAASHQVQQYQQPSNDQLIRQLEVKQRLMHRLSKSQQYPQPVDINNISKLLQQYPEPIDHDNGPKVTRRNHSSIAFPSILTIGLLGAFFYGLSWIPTAHAQANTLGALNSAMTEVNNDLWLCRNNLDGESPNFKRDVNNCAYDKLSYIVHALPLIYDVDVENVSGNLDQNKLIECAHHWDEKWKNVEDRACESSIQSVMQSHEIRKPYDVHYCNVFVANHCEGDGWKESPDPNGYYCVKTVTKQVFNYEKFNQCKQKVHDYLRRHLPRMLINQAKQYRSKLN